MVWITDITYVPIDEGWLYHTEIVDLYKRNVIGWYMDSTMAVYQTNKVEN